MAKNVATRDTKTEDAFPAHKQEAEQLPTYMRQGPGRGSEQVGAEDLVIPRLEIAQALSPCLDKTHAAYIDGCQQGDIYNSVTRHVYGPKVYVVPVLFKKEWLVWRDRAKGGGFRGAHATIDAAQLRIDEQEKSEEYQAIETAQQFVLVLTEDGATEQAVVSMSRTKMKVSRNWNSLIRLKGGDRFSRYYILMTVDETNTMNQKYKNWAVLPGKFAPEFAYKEAEAIYESFKAGRINPKMDERFDEPSDEPAHKTEY